MQGNLAQISWESIPGATGKHMPEMFSAPYEQQAEYHVSISKVFLDDNGSDIIANRLGIPSPGDFEAPGYFEGKVSPGTQTELAVPRKYKGAPYGEIEPAALDLMNAYAAVRGVTMKQDGVGYHRPFFNPKKKDANGMLLDIGRPFTEQETDLLAKKLAELSGHTDYNPIGSREGVRIINFDPSFDNKAFVKIVKDALGTVDIDANLKIGYFNSQNGYLGNDWSVNKNGEDYIRGVSERGSPDLYRKVRTIIEEIQPRVDEIDTDFSERYGWSVNSELNAGYRPGAKPEIMQPEIVKKKTDEVFNKTEIIKNKVIAEFGSGKKQSGSGLFTSYGNLDVKHTNHPTSYGNSSYLEFIKTDPKSGASLSKSYRISDHDTGEFRKTVDQEQNFLVNKNTESEILNDVRTFFKPENFEKRVDKVLNNEKLRKQTEDADKIIRVRQLQWENGVSAKNKQLLFDEAKKQNPKGTKSEIINLAKEIYFKDKTYINGSFRKIN